MKTADLLECNRWWTGHDFLKQPEVAWPSKTIDGKHTGYDETRTVRGFDYSPAIELSERKDKLVTATGDTEKIF